jgi:hypothetical protein
MSARDCEPADVVATAAIDALLAARWQCADLLSRRPRASVRDLLLGHAAELACSPIARDQILSRALEAAASDLEAGRPPLDGGAAFLFRDCPPCVTAREVVREQVFRYGSVPARASDGAAADLERRVRAECPGGHELSLSLAREAHLQEVLWDDPRLPAETHTRLIMLCAVPKVVARALALDPSHARFARHENASGERRKGAVALIPASRAAGKAGSPPGPSFSFQRGASDPAAAR